MPTTTGYRIIVLLHSGVRGRRLRGSGLQWGGFNAIVPVVYLMVFTPGH